MQKRQLASLTTTRIAYGCAPLGGTWNTEPPDATVRPRAVKALRAALDAGLDFFDHADIYCYGKSESVFAEAMSELKTQRDRIVLQSKCGIRFAGDPHATSPQRYDFSHDHIIASTEGILARLRTDRLDVLVLHRPDALVEPEEVARAFDSLHASGKVRHFAVSNHNAGQMELLRRHLRQPIIANQLQLSLVHSHLIDAGIVANTNQHSLGADGTLEYCRMHGIVVQAWTPLGGGAAIGDEDKRKDLGRLVAELATRHQVGREAIPIAWLLRHPAGIQPVIGSTNPTRIAAACQGDGVVLTREEWYSLYAAARGRGVP